MIILRTLTLYIVLAWRRGIPYAVRSWREADKLYDAHSAAHGREMTDDERTRLTTRVVACSNAQGYELTPEQIRRLV